MVPGNVYICQPVVRGYPRRASERDGALIIFSQNLRAQFRDCHLTPRNTAPSVDAKTFCIPLYIYRYIHTYIRIFSSSRRDQNFIYKNIIGPFPRPRSPISDRTSGFVFARRRIFSSSSTLYKTSYEASWIPLRFFPTDVPIDRPTDRPPFLILFYDVMTMIIWKFYGSQIQVLKVGDFIVPPVSRGGFIIILADVRLRPKLEGGRIDDGIGLLGPDGSNVITTNRYRNYLR